VEKGKEEKDHTAGLELLCRVSTKKREKIKGTEKGGVQEGGTPGKAPLKRTKHSSKIDRNIDAQRKASGRERQKGQFLKKVNSGPNRCK